MLKLTRKRINGRAKDKDKDKPRDKKPKAMAYYIRMYREAKEMNEHPREITVDNTPIEYDNN